MENKFQMTREMNVFIAKRNIVDYIYKSANLEGIAVTYPETQQLYNGGNVSRLSIDDIVAINNIKHAWQFILDEPPLPTTYAVLCEIHKIIGSNLIPMPGKIRDVPVKMGGTDWAPTLPIESQVKEELSENLKIENPTDQALTTMLWGMRRQIFLDGNKRASMLFANKILIDNGCGIIQIPIHMQAEFFSKLIEFYETNNMVDLKDWLYENCLDGISTEKSITERKQDAGDKLETSQDNNRDKSVNQKKEHEL